MRHFITIAPIPYKTAFIAGCIQRVIKQPVIGLVLRCHISTDCSFGQYRIGLKINDTRHCIRTVHQTGRTFQYLNGMYTLRVYFNAMLIAPLLTFLTHTVIHHYNPVIPQTTNDRFRNASSGSNLRHPGLFGNGIDNICRSLLFQIPLGYIRYGKRSFFNQ